MSHKRWGARALAGIGASAVLTLMSAGSALADDSVYECNAHNGGRQVALLVNHNTGAIRAFAGTTTATTIQPAINAAATDVTPASGNTSGAGDTVIVCHGTYRGDIAIGAGNDNLTVRSEDGPNGVVLLGDGKAPVVTIEDRGLMFGGPAESFTISVAAPAGTTSVTGIQDGVPGAQSTANEDEACAAAGSPASTASGCDAAAPGDVTINDAIVDNVFTNFSVPAGASVTGIKLDNTINNTVQQNLFRNVLPTSVTSFAGIVVGGFKETPPAADANGKAPTGYTTGDSTNINAALFQNAVQQVLGGGNATCGTADGIELNGFLLDAQVYNNWLQQIASSGNCQVTGIFSNAYGSLENEQTGTLVPVNANLDNNTIEQLSGNVKNSTGILLEPTPASATPGPQAPPPTCVPQLGQQCNDGMPPSSYTVFQNELQGLGTATSDQAVLGANSFIRDNNFDSDLYGVVNGGAGGTQNTNLDATNNWWGCQLSGSNPPPAKPGQPGYQGGCAAMTGPVSWAPPQTSRVENAGDNAGNNAGSS